MAFSYVIDPSNRLAVITASGVITAEEIVAHSLRVRHVPGYDVSLRHLLDLNLVTQTRLSADEVKGFARKCTFTPESPCAIVARNPVAFGLARMFQIYHETFGGHAEAIFVSEDLISAKRWLAGDASFRRTG